MRPLWPPKSERCGKFRWPDRFEAESALRAVQKKRKEERALECEQRIYQCPVCKGWHLTKK